MPPKTDAHKKAKVTSSEKRLRDGEHDPLAEELDFNELETVSVGPGWKKVPKHLRGPKHLREAREWLAREGRPAA
jgi:hypothetical protein